MKRLIATLVLLAASAMAQTDRGIKAFQVLNSGSAVYTRGGGIVKINCINSLSCSFNSATGNLELSFGSALALGGDATRSTTKTVNTAFEDNEGPGVTMDSLQENARTLTDVSTSDYFASTLNNVTYAPTSNWNKQLIGVSTEVELKGGVTTGGFIYGTFSDLVIRTSGNLSNVYGVYGLATSLNAGTTTVQVGVWGESDKELATVGVITDNYGVVAATSNGSSGSTITRDYGLAVLPGPSSGAIGTHYGVYITDSNGSGATTTDYGLYIANVTDGASNFAIQTGTGRVSFGGVVESDSNTVALTADWTCGTAGTVSSCVAATIVGSGGGVPLTFTLPLVARPWTWECEGVVGQATAATANSWNFLTATNGATNVTAWYSMNTAAAAMTGGATTDQVSTTSTIVIGPAWTLGGTATKMPFRVGGRIETASASGTVLSLQLVAPTVGDLVTIYRGATCRIW